MERPMVIKYAVVPPRRIERVSNPEKILADYLDFLAEAEETVLSPETNMQDRNEFIAELKANLKLLKTRLSVIKRRKRGGSGDIVAMYAVIVPRSNESSGEKG